MSEPKNGQPKGASGAGALRRGMPQNLDLEMSVLGGILLRPTILDDLPQLEIDDFADLGCKIVFESMRNLQTRRAPIDLVTLESEVERSGRLDAIGGVVFLGEIVMQVPTADNAITYAKQLADLTTLRRIMVEAGDIAQKARKWNYDVDELSADAIERMSKIDREHRGRSGKAHAAGTEAITLAAGLARHRDAPMFSTGFAGIDAIAPTRAGAVVVLIGGSGSGKSTLALQIAEHHAEATGPAIFVSMELSDEEVGARIVARKTDIGWFAALRGDAEDAVMRACLNLPRLRVVDDAICTPSRIRAAVSANQRLYPDQLVLVVVDYVQLLEAEGRDERERTKRAVEAMRQLAKELGCVVLLLSQTSRTASIALRDGSLVGAGAAQAGAESSQIERAAYVTITLGEVSEPDDEGDGPKKVDVSIGKVRMGGGDRVIQFSYDGRRGLWEEVSAPVASTRHRAKKRAQEGGKRIQTVADAICGRLAEASSPTSTNKLAKDLGIKRDDIYAAVEHLLGESPQRVSRVRGTKIGGSWPLWTIDKAQAAGVEAFVRVVPLQTTAPRSYLADP